MNYEILLKQIKNELSTYNIKVFIFEDNNEYAEIGELIENKIFLNRVYRDNLSLIFTIAHLFGHYVQFFEFDKYEYLIKTVEKPKPLTLTKEFKKDFYEYEKEAFGIGKSLLGKIFSFDETIDKKYSAFLKADFILFWRYLTTGKKTKLREFKKLLRKIEKENQDTLKSINPVSINKYNFENVKTDKIFVKIE